MNGPQQNLGIKVQSGSFGGQIGFRPQYTQYGNKERFQKYGGGSDYEYREKDDDEGCCKKMCACLGVLACCCCICYCIF